MGSSHEHAVIFESRDIVDEELEYPRAELHTIAANARQDISAIAIPLADVSRYQRSILIWLKNICILMAVLVSVIFTAIVLV